MLIVEQHYQDLPLVSEITLPYFHSDQIIANKLIQSLVIQSYPISFFLTTFPFPLSVQPSPV